MNIWSFVTPPGPKETAAGPEASVPQLVVVFVFLLFLVTLPFSGPMLLSQYREWSNSEQVQIRDRWIAETEDLVDVTEPWTGRDQVSIGFESCEQEISLRVGFDASDQPTFIGSNQPDDDPWIVVNEESVRTLETDACRRELMDSQGS